jgi:hypothetical protein
MLAFWYDEYSEISPADILLVIRSDHLFTWHSNILVDILSDIYSGILSDI